MSTQAGGGQQGTPALDGHQAGPAVARVLVGAHLRRLREAAKVTREEAARTIRASESKISRLELGRTGFKLRDVQDLLTRYGVTEPAESATLLAMARQANAVGWWHAYSDVMPPWQGPYLGLEEAASVIRYYCIQFVPGLLQIPDYARAVFRLCPDGSHEVQVERRVSMLRRRQWLLRRGCPPRLWTVIDEAALRRPFGGRAVMRAQLRHLIEVAELPHISIQVLPQRLAHAAAGVPVTVLRFPPGELPDVVYIEHGTGALYLERPAEVEYYLHLMDQLVVAAEPQTRAVTVLSQILKET